MWKLLALSLTSLFVLTDSALAQGCSSYTVLSNGSVADANQVMANFNCAALTSGATLYGTTLSGTTSATNTSGATIAMDKPTGAGLSYSESGVQKFMIEDDNPATSELGFYAWNGASWNNLANISNSGQLLVNTKTQPIGFGPRFLVVNGSNEVAALLYNQDAGDAVEIWNNVSSGTATQIRFIYGNSATNLGSISSDGTQTYYNTTSDERLKAVDAHQLNYRNAIERLWVGNFHWKSNGAPGFGVLAQQAYSVFPQAITKPATSAGLWEADYGKFAPLALWGVKDLYKIESAQNAKIASLQRELATAQLTNKNESAEVHDLISRVSALERSHKVRIARNSTTVDINP